MVILNDQRLSVSILRQMQSQRHRLYYVFIWEGESAFEFQYFLSFVFWNYDILNAVSIVQRSTDGEYDILTYNPFIGRNIRLAPDAYKRNEMFIEKDMNLFGYPLLITRYRSILNFYTPFGASRSITLNVDQFLPLMVANLMNATLNLSQPYTNEIDLKQIANADLLLNGWYYEPSKCRELRIEPTIAMRRDDICVLVPYKRFRPMAESIIIMLQPSVWICAMAVAFSVTVCLILISKMERYNSKEPSIRAYLFGLYGKFSRHFTSRLILANWLLYTVIITSVFQSALYDGITLEGRDPELTNISDLIDNSEYALLLYKEFHDETVDILKKSSLNDNIKVVSVKEYLDRIYSANNYVFVERLKQTNHFERILADENLLPVYYTMEPCVCPLIATYYVRRGSPFLNRINWILRQSQENGLFQFWDTRFHNSFSNRQKLFQRPKSGYLENLGFIFEYWFYALFICFLECIVELIVWHCTIKQL